MGGSDPLGQALQLLIPQPVILGAIGGLVFTRILAIPNDAIGDGTMLLGTLLGAAAGYYLHSRKD